MTTAEKIIKSLALQPHPEGGYYRETYRAVKTIDIVDPSQERRNIATSIYYLLTDQDHSNFHKIASDEVWYFHQGNTIELVMIKDRVLSVKLVGNQIDRNEHPQVVIPAGTWFAAGIKGRKGYALSSCSVSPGFDFRDFEMATRKELIAQYPYLENEIIRFTR
ncbi:cupin domain-containing protein [Bacteroidales bacterium OttesenSCG-928-B11]|nr:cupin domain-containing protein [Bacteroidales bacterium OttesenSCG-928-E04]MDL2309441.1 cupin domain-containing protein [Bacteroidales bacterium OttesenSCG-928-C03]MDL2312020.1 cupin domain-containing protein [Bacteroidales bacterium OttesenSCG-928-B11]MDL2326939.1 cupin domain-containing protein [Bacteroidales bacterium OttesenSCG-928-A14]